MTIINPEPTNTKALAPKVAWATIGTYVSGVVALALVNVFTEDNNVLLSAVLPDSIEPFLLPIVPALFALVSGFSARHQWRARPMSDGSTTVG